MSITDWPAGSSKKPKRKIIVEEDTTDDDIGSPIEEEDGEEEGEHEKSDGDQDSSLPATASPMDTPDRSSRLLIDSDEGSDVDEDIKAPDDYNIDDEDSGMQRAFSKKKRGRVVIASDSEDDVEEQKKQEKKATTRRSQGGKPDGRKSIEIKEHSEEDEDEAVPANLNDTFEIKKSRKKPVLNETFEVGMSANLV